MSNISQIVSGFLPISLDEMDDVKLMSRTDTKFAFKASKLPLLLQKILPFYKVLNIDGKIIEFPLLVTKFLGKKIPAAGGFYLRSLPIKITKKAISNYEKRGIPATFYIHSWELTPEYMPEIQLPLKDNFATRTVTEVISGERDELMNILLTSLNEEVKDLGIEIIDFRVKRIDLPSNLSNSVYERMKTERQELAEKLRSEGNEIAREKRAEADKERVVILADAYKQSQQLRGEGDATAASIYAESFSKNPEFYEFTRSMKAYVETFENKSDVMLIDSDSEFFKYLNDKKEEN